MRIGGLAERTGVSVRSLRYYEQQHLLSAERSPSGQRYYPQDAVERVRQIQQFYAAGLTSKMIRELLPCFATGEVKPELLAVLSAERDRIAEQAASLARTLESLDAIVRVATAAEQQGRPACWATR